MCLKKRPSAQSLLKETAEYVWGARYVLITEAPAERGALFYMKVTALLCQSLGKGKESPELTVKDDGSS